MMTIDADNNRQGAETRKDAKAKKRVRHPDRLTIDARSLSRLDAWIEQLTSKQRGVSVSRRDLLTWLIESHPESLSASEEKELTERFYDEEKFLRFAWDEIRAARHRGEKLTLDEILKRSHPPSPRAGGTKPGRRRKVVAENASTAIPQESPNTVT